MTVALRTRIERLEQAAPKGTLHDLPDEVLERRLDLLLHLYVHEHAGMPTEGLREELAAIRLDPAVTDPEAPPIDAAELHRQVVSVLRAESHHRASYKRLLALLGEAEESRGVG
ncbi:MAG: hypothetical protein MUC77_16495 [Chromatiaceae bacterium]|nr:hypothetical protein [Chromatiaceae bacterium]